MKLINLNRTAKRHFVFNQPGRWRIAFENLSGRLVFEIRSRGVKLEIRGVYQGGGRDEFRLDTQQRHLAGGSQSDLLIKGVFDRQARFIHRGLVRIEKNAADTQARQKSQNLILSPDCFVDSRPFLEILNRRVVCAHAVSLAPPDKEELFFLKSRGLAEKKAQELIVKGFLR